MDPYSSISWSDDEGEAREYEARKAPSEKKPEMHPKSDDLSIENVVRGVGLTLVAGALLGKVVVETNIRHFAQDVRTICYDKDWKRAAGKAVVVATNLVACGVTAANPSLPAVFAFFGGVLLSGVIAEVQNKNFEDLMEDLTRLSPTRCVLTALGAASLYARCYAPIAAISGLLTLSNMSS